MGHVGIDPEVLQIQALGGPQKAWAVIDENVYDLTKYAYGPGKLIKKGAGDNDFDQYGRLIDTPEKGGKNVDQRQKILLSQKYLSEDLVSLFAQRSGSDITEAFNKLDLPLDTKKEQLACLRNLFFVGKVDQRNSPRCQFANYVLLSSTILLVSVLAFKFIAALQLGRQRDPEVNDKFVILQIPCYTESEESLRRTINSMTALRYDDKRKLLFIIADGIVTVRKRHGYTTDRPQYSRLRRHRMLASLDFLSIGEGQQQHNRAKVYSGLYEIFSGRVVPYIVVVKVGGPGEKDARQPWQARLADDSDAFPQQGALRLANDTTRARAIPSTHHNVIGIPPAFYEFVMMVDADTVVEPDSLNRMVSCMNHDRSVMGLCGETRLLNERESLITMIQGE